MLAARCVCVDGVCGVCKRACRGVARCDGGGSGSHRPPSTLEKAKNFAASAARHVAAGMPMATDDEVARRFAICQQCEHFDGKACGKCGCPIVREKRFVSKLSWANEKCPVGKWGPAT